MKHVHHDLIVAWAKGSRIQWKNKDGIWKTIRANDSPSWAPEQEYRIAPSEPVDVYVVAVVSEDGAFAATYSPNGTEEANLKLSFDPATNTLLKAEALK